ncbi:mannose-ethanolamine phosphotransferase GPI13 [Ascoidea rubescens DSM 1968]|uniref:Alkaline phosphatase-like protein n=1 Tax=Ascoidea rubescens DSM 1968 TaxID=1344418 RepID=A0A1D2VAG3_9ASCO|nr:alkaline phosphatase-like protein [Ascoidea rubescens DSM 1968]ODV58662.1 alkaline phosphatase-like protein [Ascoidea rubescens DSM 1968]
MEALKKKIQRQKWIRLHQQFKQDLRLKKFKYVNILYCFNLFLLFCLQIIALFFFLKGFLLQKTSSNNYANSLSNIDNVLENNQISNYLFNNDSSLFNVSLNQHSQKPSFEKSIIVIIDALRFDFVIPSNSSISPSIQTSQFYHNNFPTLYQTFSSNPQNSLLLKFIADPPTTTLQRLKGLTTGSLPTFKEAGSNFNGNDINEDNLIYQLFNNNKSISFLGDDTWVSLFNKYLNQNISYPYESLNVWDLHSVDNGVIMHLFPLLNSSENSFDYINLNTSTSLPFSNSKKQHLYNNSKNWDILISHFLGVDHVGHRYGPSNYEMIPKLNQMDSILKKLIQNLSNDTLLIVMGDHGMDVNGNHGGDSIEELESTLFFYSKTPILNHTSNDLLINLNQNKINKNIYDITNNGENYRSVNQVDLVSTLSLLLNLPIPYNNLGLPIDELFLNHFNSFNHPELSNFQLNLLNIINLMKNQFISINQIHNYRLSNPDLKNDIEINNQFQAILKKYHQINDSFYKISLNQTASEDEIATNYFSEQIKKLILDIKNYQSNSLNKCQEKWAQFNMTYQIIGILLFFSSLIVLVIISKLIPSVVISQLNDEFLSSIILMIFLMVIIFLSVFLILKPTTIFESLLDCFIFSIGFGIFMGYLITIFDRYSLSWLKFQIKNFAKDNDSDWSFTNIASLIILGFVYTSNSLIIWENKIVNILLITYGVLLKKINYNLAFYHSISFIIVQRLSSTVKVCREEQINFNSKLMKKTLIKNSIKKYFIDNYQSASFKLWFQKFFIRLSYLVLVYWFLEYLEVNQDVNVNFFKISVNIIKEFKIWIARIIFFISMVLGSIAWLKGPLCIKLVSSNADSNDINGKNSKKILLGYNNLFGSTYFLLILNFLIMILLVNKPLGGILILLLVIQILTVLEIIDILNLKDNMISIILLNLLGLSYFYSTGHQATISSIQWEYAFMLSKSIRFPFTHFTLILNNFGSFILVSISIALIKFWKLTPMKETKPISLISKIIENWLTLLMIQTFLTLISMIMASHFKRHLMVWKIFTPRMLMNLLILIIMNVIILFIGIFFGVSRLIYKVNQVFG